MHNTIIFQIIFYILDNKKSIGVKNGILHSNVKNKAVIKYIGENKAGLIKLLTSISVGQLQTLHELYEERAAIIEYEGEYCKEVAEKLAMQDIRALVEIALNGIKGGVNVSNGIVLSYKENTGKQPPYWIPSKVLKGLDLELPKIKQLLKEVING